MLLPLFISFSIVIVLTGYIAWEMFRYASFWQDSDRAILRLLAYLFKVFAISLCILVFYVGAVLLILSMRHS